MYSPYKEKKVMLQKILGKSDIISKETKIKKRRRQLLGNCVWLSGRVHIEGRLNEGPRLQWKQKDENETKQNKTNVTAEENNTISARGIRVRATCG